MNTKYTENEWSVRRSFYDFDVPSGWSQRKADTFSEDPREDFMSGSTAYVVAEFDYVTNDSQDNVVVHKDADEAFYQILWHDVTDGWGVSHAHGAESEEEARGALSAILYMISHHRSDVRHAIEKALEDTA